MTTIKIKDFMILFECSKNTASKKFRAMADSLGKKEHHPITIEDAAHYLDLKPEFIQEKLKANKPSKK